MNQATEAACFRNELRSESQLQSLVFDLRVKFGFAKIAQCCLTNVGLALFSQNMSNDTLRAGLIQAVCKKQLIRTWLCG